jgi:hypothetical protein
MRPLGQMARKEACKRNDARYILRI